jgi:hypothetical protein
VSLAIFGAKDFRVDADFESYSARLGACSDWGFMPALKP